LDNLFRCPFYARDIGPAIAIQLRNIPKKLPQIKDYPVFQAEPVRPLLHHGA